MHRSLSSLALLLVACSSGKPDPKGDSGVGDASGPPACTSTVQPKVLVADFATGIKRGEPSMAGDEVFWVDDSQGPQVIFTSKTGAIMHMKLTDSAPSTLLVPTGYVYSATALGSDVFYLQEDQKVVHLFRTPIAGGPGVNVGAEIPIGNEAFPSPNCGNCRVFARKGDDVFITAAGEIDRVALSSGQKTVIALASTRYSNKQIYMGELVGDTVYYTETDGAIFSVPAAATSPSATLLGMATCPPGLLGYRALRPYSGGFLCDQGSTIGKIDATGKNIGAAFESAFVDRNVSSFMPSPVSGSTLYAMPLFAPQQDMDTSAIFKVDLGGGAPVAAVCNVHGVLWSDYGSSQLVYIEVGNNVASLRAVPR